LLISFWNCSIEHEIVEKNIWTGLKKRLPAPGTKLLQTDEIVKAATQKAATITSHRKKKDYQFLIQRYTGCRKGEAAGLRHSDIDLKEKVIRFIQWEQWVEYEKIRGGKRREKQIRKFKTGNKDERVLPMNKALYESIQDMELEDNNNPVWPLRYKSIDDSWGSHHVSEYRSKYGFTSHELRRLAVTKLTLAGISPFIIYEITRHKIEGMSDVIQMYTRPTVDELKEAIEILT